jgi:hypothetical protein
MEAAQVEAMLQEAHINRCDFRSLIFRHLKQFFGVSFFETEQKR